MLVRRFFPPSRSLALVLVSLLGVGGVLACGEEPRAPDVILVSIDTLRPDHLGCYGYEKPTSPAIDHLCERAVVFENAVAHAPSTLLSHASLFTSQIPQHHGAFHFHHLPLAEEATTLAEILRGAGYRTASFNAGSQMRSEFGLDQGFEVYESVAIDLQSVAGAALAWLDDLDADERVFLFVHTYEVHHPYDPAPEDLALFADPDYAGEWGDEISVERLRRANAGEVAWDEADRQHVVAAYDAEIRGMDRAFGRLLDGLRVRGRFDEALVVLVSDHGEEFGERGFLGWHAHTLYEELLRVPLVIRWPGDAHAGRRVRPRVALVDVAPTILDAAGVEPPAGFDGESLGALVRGETRASEPRPVIAYRDTAEIDNESITVGRYKYHAGRLFDLVADPGERRDLAAERPEEARRLRELLERAREGREGTRAEEAAELPPEVVEELRALGYVR